MREIKVNEAMFQKHASNLDSESAGSYLPLKRWKYGILTSEFYQSVTVCIN